MTNKVQIRIKEEENSIDTCSEVNIGFGALGFRVDPHVQLKKTFQIAHIFFLELSGME